MAEKFRYLIVDEDGDVRKTNSEEQVEAAVKAAYHVGNYIVIDMQEQLEVVWDEETRSLQMNEIEEAGDGERTNLTGEDL